MKEYLNNPNPLDDGWEPDDFIMDADPDDGVDVDLWQSEPSSDALGSSEYAPIGFDEPEPEGEFIGGLSRELHVPYGGIHNLRQSLDLDEFLAYVGEMTDRRRCRIEETLLSFSAPRRANWLLWLKSKKWTGKSLILFLRFYDLWNRTPEWWERVSVSSGVWRSYHGSGNAVMSRDRCYKLVHLRLDYRPRKIIDKSWFKDWDDFSLWRFGFDSFVSFAVFRASLSPDDDWERYFNFDSHNGHYDQELSDWRIYAEWWDDMSEWRDNL